MDRDEQHEDFAWPTAEQAETEDRARWEGSRDELRARSLLRPRTGLVAASPIDPPLPRTNHNVKTPAPRATAGGQTQP